MNEIYNLKSQYVCVGVRGKREGKRGKQREIDDILFMLCVLPGMFISNILLKNIENIGACY